MILVIEVESWGPGGVRLGYGWGTTSRKFPRVGYGWGTGGVRVGYGWVLKPVPRVVVS